MITKSEFWELLSRVRNGHGTKDEWNKMDTYIRELEADQEALEKLRAAVRKHRDQRGDDRCWRDDEELYQALPEGYTPPERDSAVELELCKQYIASRHDPRVKYVSPQRRIEELEEAIRWVKENKE